MSVAPLGPVASVIEENARLVAKRLESVLARERGDLDFLNSHYEGTQALSYMAPELLMELGDRMRQVIVHWPELVVDSAEERLDVEGFRLGGSAGSDNDLWSIWQGNGLDLGAHEGQVDALVMRRSYLIVGARSQFDLDPSSGVDESIPLVTVESPLEVSTLRDPRTRRVRAAAKWWCDESLDGREERRVTVYLPEGTAYLRRPSGRGPGGLLEAGSPEWVLDEEGSPGYDDHGLGVVPVVPLVNRPRSSSKASVAGGKSDLSALIPLSDAACKIATDMMIGAEFHALPRRWAVGVDASDFVDQQGRPVSALSRVAGRMWADENGDVKFGQFPEASLSNFHDTITLLAKLAAGIAGLPPHYLGLATDNPASADAIRSAEARLVKRVERKQRMFGEAYEQAMRIALLIADGSLPAGAARMETIWRDASTPTVAQSADAAVKKFQTGIVTKRQAREDLGYSGEQIRRMEDDEDREAARAARAFGVGPDPAMPGDGPNLDPHPSSLILGKP